MSGGWRRQNTHPLSSWPNLIFSSRSDADTSIVRAVQNSQKLSFAFRRPSIAAFPLGRTRIHYYLHKEPSNTEEYLLLFSVQYLDVLNEKVTEVVMPMSFAMFHLKV